MDLIREQVEHKKYGTGVITKSGEDKITVQFQEMAGSKLFQYPDSFGTFLKAVNPAVQSDIMKEYNEKQEQVQKEQDRIRRAREAWELVAKTQATGKKKTTRKTTKSKKA